MTTGKTIALTRWTFAGKVMSQLFNMLFRFVIAFLPKRKCLLISWLQSPSTVILEPKKINFVTVSIVSQSSHSPQLEKSPHSNRDLAQSKIKNKIILKRTKKKNDKPLLTRWSHRKLTVVLLADCLYCLLYSYTSKKLDGLQRLM